MIPERGNPSPTPRDDVMLAGYQECAREALQWLSGLGYPAGHPLLQSLAAHLTKKQAYLEKLDLEEYLVQGDETSGFEEALKKVRGDQEVQRALVQACFRGCDLRYSDQSHEETFMD